MAKITGFITSALLVALCLLINVVHYPNALSLNSAAENAPLKEPAKNVSPQETPSNEEPQPIKNTEEKDQSSEETTFARKGSSANDDSATFRQVSASNAADVRNEKTDSGRANFEPATMSRELPEEESTDAKPSNETPAPARPLSALSSASKPQGGKYVSIPSEETDAFGRRSSFDCRVVGATAAERLSILPIDTTGYNGFDK